MINLMRKEVLLFFRKSLAFALCALLLQVIVPLFFLDELTRGITGFDELNRLFTGFLVYFPFMSIPVVSTLVFTQNLSEERREGIIRVLLANDVKPDAIWKSKVVVAAVISEIVNLVSIGSYIVAIRLKYGEWMNFTAEQLLLLFIVIPMLSISISILLCFILWISKQGELFAGLLPYVGFFACIYFGLFNGKTLDLLNAPAVTLIVVSVLLIFGITGFLASQISKEYISNIR
ncbi:MAG: hypothetical protein K6F84_04500 [Lachnospiraceae bacterium]|nr:hypothetical protein [Lachnospiraceae bacterium]